MSAIFVVREVSAAGGDVWRRRRAGKLQREVWPVFRFGIENPDWPPVPFFQHYLFENFIPIAGLMLGVTILGLVLSVAVRRPWTKRLAMAGLAGLVIFPLLAIVVKTPREALRSRAAAVVDAATPELRSENLRPFLTEDFEIGPPDSEPYVEGREEFLAELSRRVAPKYTFSQTFISAIDARGLSETHGQAELIVVTKVEGSGFAFGSKGRFLLDFEKTGDEWLIRRVTVVSINDHPPFEKFW